MSDTTPTSQDMLRMSNRSLSYDSTAELYLPPTVTWAISSMPFTYCASHSIIVERRRLLFPSSLSIIVPQSPTPPLSANRKRVGEPIQRHGFGLRAPNIDRSKQLQKDVSASRRRRGAKGQAWDDVGPERSGSYGHGSLGGLLSMDLRCAPVQCPSHIPAAWVQQALGSTEA